ncbi:MAG: helical backbone metal receptor [Acidobacteriota bacterium]
MYVTDARGRKLTVGAPPRRVVSLVPSITETLFEIGAGPIVVGVTEFCVFPADGVAALPHLRGTKNPDVARIRELRPDLVHMNVEENLERDAVAIEAFTPVFLSEPKSPHDVVQLINTLGVLHGCRETASALASSLRKELDRDQLAPFTFACPIWKSPWMWCGGDTYAANVIQAIGGENVLAEHDRYPAIDLPAVLALQPDLLLLPDEPWAFTEADAEELRSAGFKNVLGPFPGHLITWHGARTLPGLQFLRAAVESFLHTR